MDLKEQYEKLLRYCLMLTKDRNLAEDVVQETYLRFWTNHSYQDTGRELAYLYTIARNLCMDEWRRPKMEDIEDYSEKIGDGNYEPEKRIDQIALEEALSRLPEDLREVIVLRYTNEISVTDIAKIMGISRFSVHRLIKKGLDLLRKELGGEGDE